MIDNIEIILPLLKFESKDDFYYLQILQRKKENPGLGRNSRVIKNYYIKSEKHLLDRYDEIKKLCKIFNARASIRLNKRSFEKVAFKAMVNIANSMSNKEYSFIKASYDRACGLGHNDKEKKWIIDIDGEVPEYWKNDLVNYINNIEPKDNKVIIEIPSKSGFHLITKPFNTQKFSMDYQLDVHRNNPTNLYIP
jgi:hypothetical protein